MITGEKLIITDDVDIEPIVINNNMLSSLSSSYYNFDDLETDDLDYNNLIHTKPIDDIEINSNRYDVLKFFVYGKTDLNKKYDSLLINNELRKLNCNETIINYDFDNIHNLIKLIKDNHLLNNNKCMCLRILCCIKVNEILNNNLCAFINNYEDFELDDSLTVWYKIYFNMNSIKTSQLMKLYNKLLIKKKDEKINIIVREQFNDLCNYIETNMLKYNNIHNAQEWTEYLNLMDATNKLYELFDNYINLL